MNTQITEEINKKTFSIDFEVIVGMDCQYKVPPVNGEIMHNYGDNVHIFFDAMQLGNLERLGNCHTNDLAQIHDLVEIISNCLIQKTASATYPRYDSDSRTQMYDIDTRAIWRGPIVDRRTRVVLAELIRAGTPPTHYALREFAGYLNQGMVSRHAINIQREEDEEGQIVAAMKGSKVEPLMPGTVLTLVDPMGATGSSSVAVLDFYHGRGKDRFESPLAERIVLSHFVITPEYIKRIKETYPNAHICAMRLDRGLSEQRVLDSIPGTYWNEEKGLTTKEEHGEHQGYIIPGLGDLGKRLCGTSF